jgi:transcriptional regulator with XRE-family HTH domain
MTNPSPTRPKRVGETGLIVAANVRLARRMNFWSQAELATRLTEAGRKMSLSSVCELELGTRHIDVDDLMALAVVLRINPNMLLEPLERPYFPASPPPIARG